MLKTLDLNRAGRDLAVRHLELRGDIVLARHAQTGRGVLAAT